MDQSMKDNKAVVAAFIEQVWNGGATERFDAFFALDYAEHAYTPANAQGHADTVTLLRRVIPDAHWTILNHVADEDRVICEIELTGTHQAPFRGIEPRGNAVRVRAFRSFQLKQGMIVSHSALLDTPELIRQMQAS